MPWGEAYRLTALLLTDPSSQVCAAVRNWTSPASREDMVLRDIYDLQHRSKAKRTPDAYPRPWHVKPKSYGAGISLTASEFAAMKAEIASRN